MTEAEWLACEKPVKMMRHLRRLACGGVLLFGWFGHPAYGILPRKWRLFLAACCRRVWPLLGSGRDNGRPQRLIAYAEGFVDAPPTEEALRNIERWFGYKKVSHQYVRLLWGLTSPLGSAAGELRNITESRARRCTPEPSKKQQAGRAALDAEAAAQCTLIRDLFGNPFRARCVDPVWLTLPVVSVAQLAYEERMLPAGTLDRDRLTQLADALEDAGCTDADILEHCRQPGPHVRGCWVVDLLTGRS